MEFNPAVIENYIKQFEEMQSLSQYERSLQEVSGVINLSNTRTLNDTGNLRIGEPSKMTPHGQPEDMDLFSTEEQRNMESNTRKRLNGDLFVNTIYRKADKHMAVKTTFIGNQQQQGTVSEFDNNLIKYENFVMDFTQ